MQYVWFVYHSYVHGSVIVPIAIIHNKQLVRQVVYFISMHSAWALLNYGCDSFYVTALT